MQSGFLNMQHDLRTLMPVASLFSGAGMDRLGQFPSWVTAAIPHSGQYKYGQ